MNYNFEKDVEKRFRDQKGILNRPFQEVCRLTRSEADEYYQSGQWYSIKGGNTSVFVIKILLSLLDVIKNF